MSNQAAVPIAWLNTLIGAADSAVKKHCKQNLELQSLVEYYSGSNDRDIICNEYPVWCAQTQIASLSNGVTLPQSTINVVSTKGFPLGTGGNPNATPPSIAVQTGINTWTTVTYTGTTATSFTGCLGGVGALSSQSTPTPLNGVGMPVVYFDPNGYYGQNPTAFGQGTQMIQGTQYVALLDKGGKRSNRGLIRKIGGSSGGFGGWQRDIVYQGKLGGYSLPSWPRGEGNIKVAYSSGYSPIPLDLSNAVAMLVAYMVRNIPSGSPLSSESLGSYSYSVLSQNTDIPEIGSIQRTLALYREPSF